MISSTFSPTSSTCYSHFKKTEDVTLNDVALVVTGLNDKVQLLRHEILALKDSNVRGPLGFKTTREIRPSLLGNANEWEAQVRHKHKDMQMQPLKVKQLLRYEEKQRIDRGKRELDNETAGLTLDEISTVDENKKKNIWLKLHGFEKLTRNRSVQNSTGLTKGTSCTCLNSDVHKEEIKCPKVRKKRISRGVQYVAFDNTRNGKRIRCELFNCFFKRQWCVRKKSWKKIEKVGAPVKKGSVEVIYKPEDKITNQQKIEQQRQSSRKNVSNKNDVADRTYSVEKKRSSKRDEKDIIRKRGSKDDTLQDNVDEIRERRVKRMQSPKKVEAKSITLNSNNGISKRPANNGHSKSVEGKYEPKRENLTLSVKKSTNNVLADDKKRTSHEAKVGNTNLKNCKVYLSKKLSCRNKKFKGNLQTELKTNSKSLPDDSSNIAKDKQENSSKGLRDTSKNLSVKRMTGGGEPRRSLSSKWLYDRKSCAVSSEVTSLKCRK